MSLTHDRTADVVIPDFSDPASFVDAVRREACSSTGRIGSTRSVQS